MTLRSEDNEVRVVQDHVVEEEVTPVWELLRALPAFSVPALMLSDSATVVPVEVSAPFRVEAVQLPSTVRKIVILHDRSPGAVQGPDDPAKGE